MAQDATLKGTCIVECCRIVKEIEFVTEFFGLPKLIERDMVSALHVFWLDAMAAPLHAPADTLLSDARIIHSNVEHHDMIARFL
jgi:hypothetical protein